MSLPRRGVLRRAERGERGSVLINTTGGQQLALAELDAQALGRILTLALAVMTDTHCQSEIKGVEGLYLAQTRKRSTEVAANGN